MSKKNIIPMVILLLIIMPIYNASAVDIGCPKFKSSGTVCREPLCLLNLGDVTKYYPQRNISSHFYRVECSPYISPEVIAKTVYKACLKKAADLGGGAYCEHMIRQGAAPFGSVDDWDCRRYGDNVKCFEIPPSPFGL